MQVLAVQHVTFEDLGHFEELLRPYARTMVYREAALLDFSALDPLEADLLIVLGGPIGVYETEDYPFLAEETAWLQRRLQADLPTLGICLGAQLIAAALGAKVYPSGVKEIGWSPLELSETGKQSCLNALAGQAVLHWHGDTFDLPENARLLASTPLCRQQAFARGRALALQFHPEVSAAGMERWFIGHTLEINTTEGVSVRGLRADTTRHIDGLRQQGADFLKCWMRAVGLADGLA